MKSKPIKNHLQKNEKIIKNELVKSSISFAITTLLFLSSIYTWFNVFIF